MSHVLHDHCLKKGKFVFSYVIPLLSIGTPIKRAQDEHETSLFLTLIERSGIRLEKTNLPLKKTIMCKTYVTFFFFLEGCC